MPTGCTLSRVNRKSSTASEINITATTTDLASGMTGTTVNLTMGSLDD
jgi:hypothetical protein